MTRQAVYVQDENGIQKKLSSILDQGGEGVVYNIEGAPDLLAKIYHSSLEGESRRTTQQKIEEMTQVTHLRKHSQIAWPLVSLFDERHQWCGYAMRRKQGVSLRELLGSPQNFGEMVPHWHRQHLIRLCLDFLNIVKDLSQNRVLPVDFNPSNFLVDTQSVRMHFIDCDSYQFQGREKVYLSEVVLPEMSAPEVVRANNWSQKQVRSDSLSFSIGMVIFYILTLGNSPYRHKNGTDPVQNLLQGKCALGKGADCQLPRGATFKIWSHLTYDLKTQFIQCFRDGHSNSNARPKVKVWEKSLRDYNYHIQQGHHEASAIPRTSKKSKHATT